MQKPEISVIIPVYGCSSTIFELYKHLTQTLLKISPDYEIIFVDDCSNDDAWEMISELGKKDKNSKGLLFSRNFGQHNAISAGLEISDGNWIVVMDCDLQDKPEEIINLYKKAQEGYDIVLGKRMYRKDTFLKIIYSKLFYKILGYLTGTKQDPTIGNFGIYNRKVIKSILLMKDHFRYLPAMVKWVGFKDTAIHVVHAERASGKTTYSFKKLLYLALDVILAFSDKPLRLTVKLGISISSASIIIAVISFIRYLSGNIKVIGYASLIISIWFLSGIIIFIMGIVGLYIGRIYEKVKDRPQYIIRKSINVDNND